MRDEWNPTRTGWARFSDDDRMRYRLARALKPRALIVHDDRVTLESDEDTGLWLRVVWLMLNPSNANAFKPDPTVGECIKRSNALDYDVAEVVNLFALRSPYPADVYKLPAGARGDDSENDRAILAACAGAHRVVAAWGNHGKLGDRAEHVLRMLTMHGVKLWCLGTTGDGWPKHPLARGKHRIPADYKLERWAA